MKVLFICLFSIFALFYSPITFQGEVGILGKIIDKRGTNYTIFTKKIFSENQWYSYKNYYKIYYNKYSTVPISTGKDVYLFGQIEDGYLKVEYIAPANNKSIMKIKDNITSRLYENIKNEEARDVLVSSFMGNLRDKEIFKETGTLHLFAVSGMHVFLIYSLITFFVNLLFSKRNLRLIVSTIAVSSYLILTGFTPSSVRAVSMLVVLNIFKLLDIPINSYNILGLIGYLNLLYIPENIFNISFLMSYAASFMILFTSNNVNNTSLKTLLIPVASYIGVFPLSVIYFGEISLLGLFVTPLLTPAISLLIICGLSSALLPWKALHSFSTFFALSVKKYVKLFTFFKPLTFNTKFIPLLLWSFIFIFYVISITHLSTFKS
ncbi:MAG TPA: ComEC/Rec2 family competence protein [Defluviitoga sp.]|nr:ComEC/Rec2 family competence protein [Defluviitoga sp.]HPZ29033.1 ComEC/Rec2 family competence protein [Defluviitoga sp.]